MAEIYIIGGFPRTNRVQRLVVSASGNVTEKLEDGPHIPVDSVYGASAVVGDSQTIITLIGGRAWLPWDYKYDLVWNLDTQNSSSSWTRAPDLITGRRYHCSCRLGAIIYVIGGKDSNETILASVEMLDTSQALPQWIQTQDYPLHVHNLACVVFGGEVWVSGGKTPSGLTSAVYSWNSTNWQIRPRMNQDRSGHGMVMNRAKMWVISGHWTTSVEQYENQAWHTLSPVSALRMYGLNVLWGNNVIQIAGYGTLNTSDVISDTVYMMDITTGTWSLSPITINQAVKYCAAALVIS